MKRIALALVAIPTALAAQARTRETLQYTSPAGVKYYSQVDTGSVARAEAAVKRNPYNVDTLIALGVAQAGPRMMAEAVVTFTKVIQLAPNSAVGYRWRGHRYLSVRKVDSALVDLNKAVKLDSTIYGGWYHLGVAHFLRGEFAAAAAAFGTGRRYAPDDGEYIGCTDWWWMSAMRAGQSATALQALQTMRDSLTVGHATAYMQRIRLYKGQIQPTEVFTPADTESVQVATLSFGLGNWYLVKGDTAKAKENFRRSVASGGWPGFGFMASEQELKRLEHR